MQQANCHDIAAGTLFYCLSLWVAPPFAAALAVDWRHGVLLWLALGRGARLAVDAPDAPALALADKLRRLS